jgi:hypothetical protein
MVHTTFNSEYHFGKRSSRQVELSSNLYQVVINGEDGEYIEYEIEADSHSEASAKAEALAADSFVDLPELAFAAKMTFEVFITFLF